jgi:hypothetical protein
MRSYLRTIILLILLSVPVVNFAQNGDASSSTENQSSKAPAGSREQRREDRKKWKADRKKKHEEEKAIKEYQKRIQDKPTRKRMKETRHKAELSNEHKQEFFLKRWFTRKKVKKVEHKDR